MLQANKHNSNEIADIGGHLPASVFNGGAFAGRIVLPLSIWRKTMKKLVYAAFAALIAFTVPAAAQQLVLGTGAIANSGSIAEGGTDSSSGSALAGFTFGASSQDSSADGSSGALAVGGVGGGLVLTGTNANQNSNSSTASGSFGLAGSTSNAAGNSGGVGNASGFAGFGFSFP